MMFIIFLIYFIVFISVDLCTYLKDVKKISAELEILYPSADASNILSEARFEAKLLPKMTPSLFLGFLFGFIALLLIFIFNSHSERLFGFLSSHRILVFCVFTRVHIFAVLVYVLLHHELPSEERICHNIKRAAFAVAGIFTAFAAAANLF